MWLLPLAFQYFNLFYINAYNFQNEILYQQWLDTQCRVFPRQQYGMFPLGYLEAGLLGGGKVLLRPVYLCWQHMRKTVPAQPTLKSWPMSSAQALFWISSNGTYMLVLSTENWGNVYSKLVKFVPIITAVTFWTLHFKLFSFQKIHRKLDS